MKKKGKNKPCKYPSRPPEKFNTEKRKTAENGLYKEEKNTSEVRKLISQFYSLRANFLRVALRKTLNFDQCLKKVKDLQKLDMDIKKLGKDLETHMSSDVNRNESNMKIMLEFHRFNVKEMEFLIGKQNELIRLRQMCKDTEDLAEIQKGLVKESTEQPYEKEVVKLSVKPLEHCYAEIDDSNKLAKACIIRPLTLMAPVMSENENDFKKALDSIDEQIEIVKVKPFTHTETFERAKKVYHEVINIPVVNEIEYHEEKVEVMQKEVMPNIVKVQQRENVAEKQILNGSKSNGKSRTVKLIEVEEKCHRKAIRKKRHMEKGKSPTWTLGLQNIGVYESVRPPEENVVLYLKISLVCLVIWSMLDYRKPRKPPEQKKLYTQKDMTASLKKYVLDELIGYMILIGHFF